MDKEIIATIEKRNTEIEVLKNRLDNESLSPRDLRKLQKEISKLEKMNKKAEFWGGLAKKTEDTGNKLQQVGSSMQKAGLKTTAAVWSPTIYLGYKAVKKVKGKSPESDLVELVKECEEAYRQGKITEEQMKEYIIDFVNNYYRSSPEY